MEFTLYNTLLKEAQTKKKDLTAKQKTCFIEKFKKIDNIGHEYIYALIRYHAISKNNNSDLPYNSKKENNNITYNIDNLPVDLKYIVYLFIQKHLKAMEESSKKSKSIKF